MEMFYYSLTSLITIRIYFLEKSMINNNILKNSKVINNITKYSPIKTLIEN